MKYKILLTIITILSIISCNKSEDKKDVTNTITNFSDAIFKFKYNDACKYITPDSKRIVNFMASNIDSKSIAALHDISLSPIIKIKNVSIKDDTLAIVKVNVKNEAKFDSIGKAPTIVEENVTYEFKLVKKEERWLIKMADLPRSEK